jgi:hypothetical protein
MRSVSTRKTSKQTQKRTKARRATKPPSKPPLVRGEAVVQKILEAAREELATVGYRGFRIEEVAARAEVNKTTIYRRWPAKADLVREALGWKIRVQVHVDDWRSLPGRHRWSVTETDANDGHLAEYHRSHNTLLLRGRSCCFVCDSERCPKRSRNARGCSVACHRRVLNHVERPPVTALASWDSRPIGPVVPGHQRGGSSG